MKNIGLVDDRTQMRRSTARRIRRFLTQGWICLDIEPFCSVENYFSWIIDNHISGVILDQRLNEQVGSQSQAITYNGNELAKELRKRFPDMPIYSITSYSDDDEIRDNFDQFEHIFARRDFRENSEKTMRVILRGCSRYHEENLDTLNRLGELSRKAAEEGISNEEREELASLQEYLNLPDTFLYDSNVSELINSISDDAKRLDKMLQELEERLE